MKQKIRDLEALMMQQGKIGETFYTKKDAKTMTASACYYNRVITTEKVIVISNKSTTEEPASEYMIKVTIKE